MIGTVCLQCGTPSDNGAGPFCRRCGLPYGQPPRADRRAAELPGLLRTVDDDGRLPSLERAGIRVDLVRHQAEHDRHPVGDDDWLESLRTGDRIRIGRWSAPFDTVRRYLVTGQVEAGRNRALAHDAIVTAMTQINRWGPDGDIFGDLPDWKAARARRRRADGALRARSRLATSAPSGVLAGQQPPEPVLVEDRDAELLRLRQLRAGALAGDEVVGLLRDRARGLAAGGADRLLRLAGG